MSYTTDHSPTVLRTHNWRTASNSAPHLLPHILPTHTILDIGCGPGSITLDFARLTPSGHVTGIEYVSDPLAEARSLAASQGITNVTFSVGDIHALPFEDESFDIVHVHQVLQHITDPVLALKEMRRVVKKGGIVAARESDQMSWFPENAGIEGWRRLTGKMMKAKGCTQDPGRMLHVWAEEAGFVQERIRKSVGSWCFSTPEERQYWGGSMEGRMRSSGMVHMAVGDGFASKEELEGIANGWREFIENEQGWFAVTHGEILCWK